MAYIDKQLQEYAKFQSYGKGHGINQKSLKDHLKLHTEKWSAAQNKKKEAAKKDTQNKDDKHTPFSGKVSAVLWKNSAYRKNTYAGIGMDEGRYKDFTVDGEFVDDAYAHLPGHADIFKTYFGFGDLDGNFNTEAQYDGILAGCSMPYRWNAHHMIPGSAFYKQMKDDDGVKSVFTDDQYTLLLMSDYDVNNGHNMIPLPDYGMDFFQPVHKMLLHPSDHKKYTQQVQDKMKKVSKRLEDIESKADEPHPDVSVKIAERLNKIEKELWKFLVQLGKKSVTAKVRQIKVSLTREEKEVLGDKGEYGSLQ